MEFQIIEIFNRTVTIELCSEEIYSQKEAYEILLDGEILRKDDKNVVTVDGLEPDREYRLGIREADGTLWEQNFLTKRESVLLNVQTFGAKGDGVTDDTAALQTCMESCPADGTVYVPAGTYLTRPLFLKSHISLWLDEGATLLGDPDRSHYGILPGMIRCTDEKEEYNLGTWEGNPLDCFASLITGIDAENVDIYGRGALDGNAAASDWWDNCKVRRVAWRPYTVYLCRCKNVRMQGITVKNSPSWTIHPYYSDDLCFLNVTVKNPDNSPNTDGLDPQSCENVRILGCVISVGDDCIAIKSGKYYMALNHHKKTRHVEVRNCRLERGHGSVTVGSEVAGGVEDVRISKCLFHETDRGLRIKTRRGRGRMSVLGDIRFERISMVGVPMPFTVNMFYYCDPDGHSEAVQDQNKRPVDELTPCIRSISAEHIDCEGVNASLICAYGLPEMPIEELRFENISASFLPEDQQTEMLPVMMDGFEKMKGRGVFARNVKKLILKNVEIKGSADTEPELIDVEEKEIENVRFS